MKLLEDDEALQQMELSIALRIIRKVLVNCNLLVGKATVISIFLGIDEYQTIPREIDELTTCILEASLQLVSYGIHVYPMMAGTEWAKIDGPGSSKAQCQKITIPFLSPKGSLQISQSILQESVHSEVFRNTLAKVGQVARAVVDFTRDLKMCFDETHSLSTESIEESYQKTVQCNASQWEHQTTESILKLIAFAVTCVSISPSDCPSISFSSLNNKQPSCEGNLSWQQLADRGLLQLLKRRDTWTVDVPMIAIVRAASTSITNDNVIGKQFVDVLRKMIDLITSPLEEWQKWERFVALSVAAKLNAWQLIGRHQVSLEELFRGLVLNISSNILITLKPTFFFEANESLSPTMDVTNIMERGNALNHCNLLSEANCCVCLNGNGGEEVDVFFHLRGGFEQDIDESRKISILMAIQCKRESKSLTKSYVSDLVTSIAMSIPNTFTTTTVEEPHHTNNKMTIKMIFSCHSAFGVRCFDFPDNCGVYSRNERSMYMGSLRNHPCASILININTSKISALESYLGNKKMAKLVKEKAKESPFLTSESLVDFLTDKNFPIDHDLVKEHFLFPNEEQ